MERWNESNVEQKNSTVNFQFEFYRDIFFLKGLTTTSNVHSFNHFIFFISLPDTASVAQSHSFEQTHNINLLHSRQFNTDTVDYF